MIFLLLHGLGIWIPLVRLIALSETVWTGLKCLQSFVISLLSNFSLFVVIAKQPEVKPGQQTHASGHWYGKLYGQRLKMQEVHNALDRSPLQSNPKSSAIKYKAQSPKPSAIAWSPLQFSPKPEARCKWVQSPKFTAIESKARSSLQLSLKPKTESTFCSLKPVAIKSQAGSPV